MNSKEKTDTLRQNNYSFERLVVDKKAVYEWRSPKGELVASESRNVASTNKAHKHLLKQEALEASRAQAANDLAGEAAYEEAISFEEIEFAIYPDKAENAQLRAENEALKAENARLTAGIADAKEIVNGIKLHARDFAIFSAVSNLNVIFHELEEQAPAPTAQAASEVPAALDKPKKAVPTRMRVNWGRGFSSGSYPVLGYSPSKQYYILDISTDCNRAMPKPVRFADCLEA